MAINMKKFIIVLTIILSVMSINLLAVGQECGPNCPLCSGSGLNSEALLSKGTIMGSLLVAPGGEETIIPAVKFALHKRIDLGIGYINKSNIIIWNTRFLISEESEKYPGIIIGSGSVRTGGSDQSVFITATKNLEDYIDKPFRFSFGTSSVISDLHKIYFIGTVSYLYKEKIFPFLSYDGLNAHLGFSYILKENFNIGLILIEKRYVGISTGIRFNLQ